jgi:hypothetical protein
MVPDIPEFKVPAMKFAVPDFKVPDFKAPDFKKTDIDIPDFKAPDIKIPEFSAPKFALPKMDMPKIDMPKMDVPKVETPKFAVPSGNYDVSDSASKADDSGLQELLDESAKGARSIYKEADQTAKVIICCDKLYSLQCTTALTCLLCFSQYRKSKEKPRSCDKSPMRRRRLPRKRRTKHVRRVSVATFFVSVLSIQGIKEGTKTSMSSLHPQLGALMQGRSYRFFLCSPWLWFCTPIIICILAAQSYQTLAEFLIVQCFCDRT